MLKRVFLMVLLSVTFQGGHAADVKIGFVDIPYLIDEAPQAQAASSRLEQEFAPRQNEIRAQKKRLADLRRELDEGANLDQTRIATIEREIRKTERRVRREEQEFREELNIQKNHEFKQVRVYVLDAIAVFAKENRYDLIISDGVLFANKTIDVTEQVLLQLQRTVDSN